MGTVFVERTTQRAEQSRAETNGGGQNDTGNRRNPFVRYI